MKFNTIKNARKNIISGTVLKIYQIVIPFLIRTAMIYYMGIQFVGLNSLFTSILGILNLIELGIGSVIVFSMYKPVAEDDEITICALLQLYKIYYRIIGCVILVIGLIICPFMPYLIKNDIPYGINVYILYLINLFATVLSYWICAYKGSVLVAHQRNDIGNKVTLIVNTVQYIIQFLVLVYIKNYYLYVLIALLTQMNVNIICAVIASKIYPKYKAYGKLEEQKKKEVNKRIKDLFITKISWVIISYSDTIIISAFLGLTILAIYNNYAYIVNSIIGIVGVIFLSYAAGIGNSLILESTEKNYKDFNKLTFLVVWISSLFTSELLCLYQPFMKFWVGENLTLNFIMVILFCIYYYIYEINSILELYKDSAGIWHKDKFRVILMAVIKLILNIILVNIIGIYSVPLSTIISMIFIGLPWIIHNLFNEVFKTSKKQYVIKLLIDSLVVFIIAITCYAITSLIKGYSLIALFLKAFVCLGVNTILMYIIHRNTPEFKSSKNMIMNFLLKIYKKK